MAVIGSLSVKLGLVTVEWDQATAKAKAQAKDLQKTMNDLSGEVSTLYGHWKTLGGALTAGALGLAALTTSTLEFANSVKDLAQGFDLSIAKTLQFRDAIQGAGGKAEGAEKILSTLFSKISDAQHGNESSIAMFEKLGISFQELATMKPDEALNRVYAALAKIGNTYERTKSIKDLLGKSGIGQDVKEVADKLQQSTAAYQKHEQSIAKLAMVSDNLKQTLDNLKIAFADMIAPLARDGVISIEKFKAAMVAITAASVIAGLFKLYEVTKKIVDVWKSGAKVSIAMQAIAGPKGLASIAAATAAYLAAIEVFDLEAENADRTASGVVGTLPGQETPQSEDDARQQAAMEANRRELAAGNARIANARTLIGLDHQQASIKELMLTGDKTALERSAVEVERQAEITRLAGERAQSLNKENLSAAQKSIIQGEYNVGVEKANQKAKDSLSLIDAQNKLEQGAIDQKTAFNAESLKITGQEAQMAVQMLTGERFANEVQQANLTASKEKLQVEAQLADSLAKENQSEKQRQMARLDAGRQLQEIEQRKAGAVAVATEKREQELRVLNLIKDAGQFVLRVETMRQELRMKSLSMGQYELAMAQSVTESVIAQDEVRRGLTEALAQNGKSEVEIQQLKQKAENDIALIVAKQKNDVGYLVAARAKELDASKLRLSVQQDGFIFDMKELALQHEMTKLQLNASNYSALELVYAKENLDIERKRADIKAQKVSARATMGTGPLLDAELERLTELEAAQERLTTARKEYAEISDVAARNKELKSMALRLEVQKHLLGYDLQELELQSESSKMSVLQLANDKEELSLKRKLLDIAAQRANATQTMSDPALLQEELKRLDQLEQGERRLSEARQKYAALEEERRQSFGYGWSQAYKKFQQDAEDYSRLGSDSFGIVINGMSSEIDRFAKGSETSFERMTASILQDITLMIAKFYMMQMVMMTLKAMGFSGGFGGVSLGSGVQMSGGFGSTPMAASGGEIDRPTIVGENGPELFVPSRRGSVIPNIQAGQYSGGGASTVYNGPYIANMNAIDTQSGIQFLSKNKSTIWAANQSAQRGLPMSK